MVMKSDKTGVKEGNPTGVYRARNAIFCGKRSRTTGMILDWVILRVSTVIRTEDFLMISSR